MKISEGLKRVVITNILFTVIFCFAMYGTSLYMKAKNIEAVNNSIAKIVSKVQEKYPNITEQDIIKILREDVLEDKENIFQKYGIEQDEAYIKQLEKGNEKNTIWIVVLSLAFCITVTYVFVKYQRNKDKRILEINNYLKEINNKNYELKIKDNGENELAKLRNELYKTTVLLKETAEDSEKQKQNLSDAIADISHQLKTPLTSIRILLDSIEDNENMDTVTRKDFLKEISNQIDHITSLVIILLKLAKLDANAVKLEKNEIILDRLIKEVIDSLAILIELKQIKITTNISPKAKIIGDYKWQKEAISNILKNALEHSENGANIYITVENSSVMVKVIIKDEGEGIDKEDIKHIFERFYKSKNASESSFGIGLALSKIIIEKDNGYINVKSEKNKGTEFEIRYLK